MLFTFELNTKILFGVGSIIELGKEAKKLGRKALIVTYPDIRRVGLLDKVLYGLKEKGLDVVTFEKVQPNPRATTVDEGTKFARKEKIDLVIGLGGGSVMDTAKGIAAAYNGVASIWNYVERKAQIIEPVPPIIQVPTIAGTGSEINEGAVITNWETHTKSGFGNPLIQAKVAIIDPELTLTVPLNQIKAGGVDIFSHVVEHYVTDDTPSSLTDGISETCLKIVVEYLPRAIAHPDDIKARTELSWASTVAMSAFSRLGGGGGSMACHPIEHALSGYYDITHGEGLAALLPVWMRYFHKVNYARFETLGKNVFKKEDGLKATEDFLDSIGMRLRLGALGCKLEDTQTIVDLVLKTSPLDANTVTGIYRDSF